ncbi:hypothetical protein [Escherichia coli]|uniref:hypothetical protein n=1 Tax=Escherichia coli TaxID=562 RepID=UPI002882F9E3|nr:hypothetical protein [Escherichia coli]
MSQPLPSSAISGSTDFTAFLNLLVAGRWSLVAGRWSLVAGRWSLVAGRWSLVAGRWSLGWSLVAGRWSLVAGRWSLVAGRWSLVAGRWSGSIRSSFLKNQRFFEYTSSKITALCEITPVFCGKSCE